MGNTAGVTERRQSLVNQKASMRMKKARDTEERLKCDRVRAAPEEEVSAVIRALWPSMEKRKTK